MEKEGRLHSTNESAVDGISRKTTSDTELTAIAKSEEGRDDLTLDIDEKGNYRNTFGNYCEVIAYDKYLAGKIRLNVLNNRETITGVYWNLNEHVIQDVDLYMLRRYIAQLYGLANKESIRQAVTIAAYQNQYHPIREALSALRWDGMERIGELFPRYLGAERSPYTKEITLILLHGAIQRVMNPGCKYDLSIIIADKKQGTGKSTICRLLALRDDWFTDSLGDLGNLSKAYETISGHWVIELGEMIATKRTKDIETIKSYLSRTSDEYRQPYGIYSQQIPRQCIFIGTSNKPQFLPDDMSGNRRFLPLLCDGDKAERHPLDDENETREYIRQCYAEAIHIGQEEGWHLTLPKEYAEEAEAFRGESTPDDGRAGIIQEWLRNTDEKYVCTRMIFDKCFDHSLYGEEPSRFDLAIIADIMNFKIVGWTKYKGQSGDGKDTKYRFEKKYGTQRAWVRVDSVPSDGAVGYNSGYKTEELGTFSPVAEGEDIPF